MPSVRYMALRDGDGCQKCETKKNLTRDHIWPKSKGGCSCEGNFQILCEDCNGKKGNDHDGRRGHAKADCPEAELRRFMSRWKEGHHEFTREYIEELVPEMETLAQKLSDYRCSPLAIQKAHSMVGSLRAYARDFAAIREQQAAEKPVTLEGLLKVEAKLVEKLGYVREQIAELQASILEDDLLSDGGEDGDLDAGAGEGQGVAEGAGPAGQDVAADGAHRKHGDEAAPAGE